MITSHRKAQHREGVNKNLHGSNDDTLRDSFDAIPSGRSYESRDELKSVLRPHKVLEPLSVAERKNIMLVTDLANEEIDWSQNLLGYGWLERTCGNIIVAPSGVGKSCLDMQGAILWACGLPAFGIRCEHPLRQWLFQHEDRRNDLRWMARMIEHLKLTPRQVQMVRENLRVMRLVGVQGKGAIDAMARHCNFFPPDLIHINPLATYMEGKFQSEEDTNTYLYHQIDTLLREFDCGLLGILHTAKTIGKTYEELDDPTQRQYLMSGRANWTNWGRGIIDIMPIDSSKKVFGFNASKRGDLIGWANPMTVWKWAPRSIDGDRILLWLPGDSEDKFTAIKGSRMQSLDLLIHIPSVPAFTTAEQLYEKVNCGRRDKNNRIGQKRVKDMLENLANDNKIIAKPVRSPKGGQPQIRYSQGNEA